MIDILARATFDALRKYAVPAAVAGGAALAAWYADKKVKGKTGKHIHQHAAEYVKKLWSRLKRKASDYIHAHPLVEKVYINAASIAAAIKRAQNEARKFFQLKVFGKEADAAKAKVVFEEEVDLDKADAVLAKAKTNGVLAIQS